MLKHSKKVCAFNNCVGWNYLALQLKGKNQIIYRTDYLVNTDAKNLIHVIQTAHLLEINSSDMQEFFNIYLVLLSLYDVLQIFFL